jgi:hypothetical protein
MYLHLDMGILPVYKIQKLFEMGMGEEGCGGV